MLEIKNLFKSFNSNKDTKEVLKNINLKIEKANIVGIIGPSGVGKTTILNLVAGLIKPDEGQIIIDNNNIVKLNNNDLRDYQKELGVVFQDYNLLSHLTIIKNVSLPLKLKGIKKAERLEEAKKVLNYVGLLSEANSYPSELSGGMRQRAAIARAIISKPKLLLLDEVTSSLDVLTANTIINLLKKIKEDFNITILIVSHDLLTIKKLCNVVYILNEGIIAERIELDNVIDNSLFDYKKELGVS